MTESITVFLRHAGRILLLRSSRRMGTYWGRWGGISGSLGGADPLDRARQEIRRQTGLSDAQVELICRAPRMKVSTYDLGTMSIVHPFLFDVPAPITLRVDRYKVDMKWVTPDELAEHHTVPRLGEALASCLKAARSRLP